MPRKITIATRENTSLPFDIDAVRDYIVDGVQTIVISTSAAGHKNWAVVLDVKDNGEGSSNHGEETLFIIPLPNEKVIFIEL